MRRLGFLIIVFGVIALGRAAFAGDNDLPERNIVSHASFQPSVRKHETHAGSQGVLEFPTTSEVTPGIEPVSPVPPTRSSFMATWDSVDGAKGYLLDVSTSSSFSTYMDGYHDLDVGNVSGRAVTGLNPATTYYYRVRPYAAAGSGGYSNVTTATTEPTTGLTINATFDSSITGNPNAAAIEAMISRAIAIHESLFSDPITIQILFRYSTTEPDGTPLSSGTLAESDYVIYDIPWNDFISALRAAARSSNDNLANASLPGSALSTNIVPSSANGRALGLDTPPGMFANGTVGNGPYDGIVTLNSASPFQFSRPPSSSNWDAQSSAEHETDEVMGLGSRLNTNSNDLCPQDLFSWSSAGVRNITSSGTRYFSINGGVSDIVGFNQDSTGDFGDWLSDPCPQTHPYVQNAFSCPSQYSDISATSPEGINLDVIGYDLINPVAVTTNVASNITSSSATLNGAVNPNGQTTSVHFEYGPTTTYGSSTATHNYNGTTAQSVSANITGLSSNTTYHFRFVASNSGGTIYGSDRTFSTLTPTGAPGVTTNSTANVAGFSATLNGSVYPHGLSTTVYFQYGMTTGYGHTTASQTKSGNTYQSVSASISGLATSTRYHFRIVAVNSAGTTYGADLTFTTLSPTGPPVVTTNPATLIASYSATLNGSVDPHGLTTTIYFQYGTTTSYGLNTSIRSRTGNTYQTVNASISRLIANTTYHFRIVATNSAGTTYGSDSTFTTLSATGPPVVTTKSATNVASSSATLNGTVDPHGLTTSVHFQYGTTTGYGSTTANHGSSGNTYQNASANITTLSGSTTYHFRVVATNSAGTTYGTDKTFTTP